MEWGSEKGGGAVLSWAFTSMSMADRASTSVGQAKNGNKTTEKLAVSSLILSPPLPPTLPSSLPNIHSSSTSFFFFLCIRVYLYGYNACFATRKQ